MQYINRLLRSTLTALGFAILAAGSLSAQIESPRSGALYDELARMDSLLFDAAFVTCNYPRIDSILSPDVEFYHDQNGLHADTVVRSDFRRLTGNCPSGQGVTRELVPGNLEVYPISNFGAIQMGVHRFNTRGEAAYTIAKFIHLWRREPDGRWILTRVLSFDHKQAQ